MRDALSMGSLKAIYGQIARRYDLQHALITAHADQRGRKILVDKTVREGDRILDCGSGTGSTALLAAERTGPAGHVTLFDLSEDMLAMARSKAVRAGLLDRVSFKAGDMLSLPFADNGFDVVLSSYSLCPVYDPARGALEMYRVVRPGGLLAAAHSSEPGNPAVKWLADRVEDLAWRLPWLSMGCRAVEVLPALERAGAEVIFRRTIGVPLWPFFILVVKKPAT